MQLLEVVTGHSQFLSHFSIQYPKRCQPSLWLNGRLLAAVPELESIPELWLEDPPFS